MKTVLICAMSLDGRIARAGSSTLDWTTPEDRQFFVRETKRIGVVVMGNATFKSIGRLLPGRLNVVMTRSLSDKENVPGMLEFTEEEPAAILDSLARWGFEEVAIVGGGQVNAAFLQAGLIDEIWVSVVPKILGNGVGLFGNESLDVDLEYFSQEMLSGQVVLLRYRVGR